MNILFDLISTQGFINGGAEYVKRVFWTMMDQKTDEHHVFCLYDSKLEIISEDVSPFQLYGSDKTVFIDINHHGSIEEIVDLNSIDIFFIGIASRYLNYNLRNVRCRCICVVHDFSLYDLDGVRIYLHRKELPQLIRILLRRYKHKITDKNKWNNMFSFWRNHPNLKIITVSEFTRASLLTSVLDTCERIQVLYSPEKMITVRPEVENKQLSEVISSKCKYYLIVSANRDLKNAKLAISAVKRFFDVYKPDAKLITIGYSKQEFDNHIILPYLSTSDLENAYRNCYALIYPTLWEGFGYPPLEAMKYGKPILSSNVCSMREVLQDAPIYFSPYYESDIFWAMERFSQSDYELLAQRSKECYMRVNNRQHEDLNKLIRLIIR